MHMWHSLSVEVGELKYSIEQDCSWDCLVCGTARSARPFVKVHVRSLRVNLGFSVFMGKNRVTIST